MHPPPRAMSTGRSTGRPPSSIPTSPGPTAARGGAGLLGRWRDVAGRDFRFHHISTDEVFGNAWRNRALHRDHRLCAELALFGLQGGERPSGARLGTRPTACPWCCRTARTITAPSISPEKLIPVVILNALAGRPIPVYGKGENVRDWLMSRITRRPCSRWSRRGGSARATISAAMPRRGTSPSSRRSAR